MEELDDEHVLVIRRQNRVLRKVHRTLRRAVRDAQHRADETFAQVCEVKTEAELAMEKLWTLGGFSCGPQDYDYIVESCLRALNPIDQS